MIKLLIASTLHFQITEWKSSSKTWNNRCSWGNHLIRTSYFKATSLLRNNFQLFWQVKRHPFFKDINWDTLARQKVISRIIWSLRNDFWRIWNAYTVSLLVQAMFIPSTDAHDTSYFMSRYIWNPEDDHVNGGSDFDDMTETCSSGSYSNIQSEEVRFFITTICCSCYAFARQPKGLTNLGDNSGKCTLKLSFVLYVKAFIFSLFSLNIVFLSIREMNAVVWQNLALLPLPCITHLAISHSR